ncbi:MAG: T9SS type A sorting domain-containing protein [Taibaiella sp.]|nr:T9SS type A sorting domain-containing protein [Taibaiella sp.]
MTRRFILLLIIAFSLHANAQNKIKYYFTQPVNTSVSKGVNAQYLNNTMGDTIIAYINRSKYTLDIAVYNYTSTFPGIAVAVNNAHNRGVKVRWIYDVNSSNTGVPLLNTAINRLASPPDAGNYTIMHNKFMAIDANSPNPADAIVWTGSSNWNAQQFNDDYNNAVVIQDQALARAYRAHFNMMWGDTGIAPNSSLSKFGQYKTDLGAHSFVIEGKVVELYFSPSDGTNAKIQNAMNSANTDMYFGMSTFTLTSNASLLVSKHNSGTYVLGINDPSITTSFTYSMLTSGMGSNFKVHTAAGLYHHKFLIVDPSNSCSDPQVVTGSHNWSFSADTKNDENTLIIHDKTAANVFYQAFHANFVLLGGSPASIADCPTSIPLAVVPVEEPTVFPNPSNGNFTIKHHLNSTQKIRIEVCNLIGQIVFSYESDDNISAGEYTWPCSISTSGMYVLRVKTEEEIFTKLITVD